MPTCLPSFAASRLSIIVALLAYSEHHFEELLVNYYSSGVFDNFPLEKLREHHHTKVNERFKAVECVEDGLS